jgi:VWFA-related protein
MHTLGSCFAAVTLSLIATYSPQQIEHPAPVPDLSGTYTLSTNAKLVILDVVVTGKKGNLIPNLKKEDFEIQEDKQIQPIYSFEAPGVHALPPNVAIHSTEELDRLAPHAPAVILALDESMEKWDDQAFARDSIQRYLKSQSNLLSQPTMLLAINADRTIVLRDYTQDKTAIITALDKHFAGNAMSSGNTLRNADGFGSLQIMSGFRSLAQLAQSTAGHPGHKSVIWVGRGLPPLHFIPPSPKSPFPVCCSEEDVAKVEAATQKMINLLTASRVTLYTIDPRGVGHSPSQDHASFAAVAEATGGEAIYNGNDVDAEIGVAARQGENFYTLSYIPRSDSDAKGELRHIRVIMKDPSLQATTRTGYYPNPVTPPSAITAEGRPGEPMHLGRKIAIDKNAINKTLLDTTLVYDGIPLTLARADASGTIAVHMDPTALHWVDHGPDRPRTAEVQVACEAFDKKEKVLLDEGTTAHLLSPPVTPENEQQLPKPGISFNCGADPRAVRLRVVVLARDSGKVGAANLDLTAK